MLTAMIDNAILGLSVALTWENLLFCFLGVFIGTFVGVIPGIGSLATISMLLPITFHLDPTAALVLLAGIFYGASYGGSTASILLNLPGTPSSAVTCLDGYPMAQQGRAGVALLMTSVASFIGGTVSIVLMMLLAPAIVVFALRFGSPEYFSLMLFGLIAASTISPSPPLKGIAMVVAGVLVGLVGTDIVTGMGRYTFGVLGLRDGVNIVIIAMGLFGIAEVIDSMRTKAGGTTKRVDISFRSMIPTIDDMKRSRGAVMRGSGIGAFFGTLPGAGGLVAAFISYAIEKRVSDSPERFGKGAVEGIVAPEAANNAADQAAFIPTLTLGIPGSATMALIIGTLMIHGITPGPGLVVEQPGLFWGLVMSFWIGNIMLLVLNIPLIGLWVRILTIPYNLLYPAILIFVCLGVYSVSFRVLDIWLAILFGVIGYFMRRLDFPPAPLILGFVLGPMMEDHFRRALMLARGDLSVFVSQPISAVFLALTAALLAGSLWRVWAGRTRLE